MSAVRILAFYRVVFGTLIVLAGVQTLVEEPEGHATVLAAVEILGALLLFWRRTQWTGAAVLLVVLAAAQAISAAHGSYTTRYLQYAASTILIVVLDRSLTAVSRRGRIEDHAAR